jgi:hypothetical protein
MTSTALADLEVRLNEVRLLAQMDPRRREVNSKAPVSNAVNRACLVLLCAHLEGFLEDLVVEALDTMAQLRTPVAQLPMALRALHVEEHLRRIEPLKDRNARAPHIERMFQIEASLWERGACLTVSMLRPKTVCAEMSNPGSKQVRRFLSILDVDISQFLRDEGATDLLGRIDGLVSRRNAIAHGDLSTNATFIDVDLYIELVRRIADAAEAATASTVQRICGLNQLPWPWQEVDAVTADVVQLDARNGT